MAPKDTRSALSDRSGRQISLFADNRSLRVFRLHDSTLVLSAADIAAHLACRHLAQQRLAIARGERGPPHSPDDPHTELVRRRGDRHEAEQLDKLTLEADGDLVDLAGDFDVRDRSRLEAAVEHTARAMRSGARLIFQPIFFNGRWMGRADFLRRVDTPSRLGSFTYEVLDTKLSRQVKPAMVHQLALYSRLVGAVQGAELPVAYVILGDGTVEAVDLRRFAALHRRVVGTVEAVVAASAVATFPEPVEHCAVCDFETECLARRVAVDHLSLVAGARREHREHLVALGLPTLAALAEAPASLPAVSLRAERFETLRHQARLQVRSRVTGQPCHRHLAPDRARGYARLRPPSPGDVFFDLECDPFALPDRGLEYLWGWWTADTGYDCVWAHDAAAEKAALERFVGFVHARLAAEPGMHVYHYAPHEVSTLRTLATRYATCEEEVDDLLRREVLVDLYTVVRQGLQVGEDSYSIKRPERHHGFVRLEHSVRQGGGSIVAYERWLDSGDSELLEAIRAYNEDDCRSTHALRDWLWEQMRPEAATIFGVDFAELALPEPEQAPTPPPWLPDVEAVIARLTAQLADDPAVDGPREAARRLLAYLLLYHRREGKPSWWRYFDLRGKTPAELVDERDAIGLLALDTSVAPVPVKRSLDWTLRFPPQEFKLDTGDAEDPTTGEGYAVVAVEDDQLVLRRGKDGPARQPAALIAGSPINVAVLREALLALAASELAEDGALPGGAGAAAARAPAADERGARAERPGAGVGDAGTRSQRVTRSGAARDRQDLPRRARHRGRAQGGAARQHHRAEPRRDPEPAARGRAPRQRGRPQLPRHLQG
jgi:predicted RecB family nuclease